jgi:acetyltransferase-like isoleucine patch superfamily enzyme
LIIVTASLYGIIIEDGRPKAWEGGRVRSSIHAMSTREKVRHIFGGISESNLEGFLDETGFLTAAGKRSLENLGVKTGARVSIGRTTLRNLAEVYNAWRAPERPVDAKAELLIGREIDVPEDDLFLWDKLEQLRRSYKMRITIGDNTKIGAEVNIGLGVSIGSDCEISERCELDMFSTLHDGVFLGRGVFVGKDSDVESGSRLLDKAVIAPRCVVKKKSLIRPGAVFKENKKYQGRAGEIDCR